MRYCNDSSCHGDCTWCNRAPVENRGLPKQAASSFAIPARGCADTACGGDCTWCNRALIEMRPVAARGADRIAA